MQVPEASLDLGRVHAVEIERQVTTLLQKDKAKGEEMAAS
jgi:hypothetical protein